MSQKQESRGKLFGMGVDIISLDEASKMGMALIGGGGGYIVTINPEMCMKSLEDATFKEAVQKASIVVPDGAGAVWALKKLGFSAAEKVPGIELAESLAAECAKTGVSVFMIGAKPGVAERAACKLVLKYKGLKIAGVRDGYYKPEELDAALAACVNSGAGLALVAMGAGRQEDFMRRACLSKKGIAMIGIGGSFDVFAGDVKRAPRIFRQLSLEWLYRGLSDLGRFKRLLKLPVFLFTVITKPRLARDGRAS